MSLFSEQLFCFLSAVACWGVAGIACAARPRPRLRAALQWLALLVATELLMCWTATLPPGSHGWLWTAVGWALRAAACVGMIRAGHRKQSRLARYALPAAFLLVLAGGGWALWSYHEEPVLATIALAMVDPASQPDQGQSPDASGDAAAESATETLAENAGDAANSSDESLAPDTEGFSVTTLVTSRELRRGGLAILPIAAFVLIVFGLSRLPYFR